MNPLIAQAWDAYRRAEAEGLSFVVRPSIPILFFGDREQYFASPLKVVTVGLNPSRKEFPVGDRFARFPASRDVYPGILEVDEYSAYLTALSDYFRVSPYTDWFDGSFKEILQGMEASFYDGAKNTALHTDLCSSLATDPTWRRLDPSGRAALEDEGVPLWHQLVQVLDPDVILVSVARANVDQGIRLHRLREWRDIYTVERMNPYRVEAAEVELTPGRSTLLVFGRAAQKPFGPVSNLEKRRIGETIGRIHAGG